MKISAGTFRGRRLTVPADVRPTAARVREALFSIWSERVRGAKVLDLFAGSGAVGFEALSRGAASVILIERSKPVLERLRRNGEQLGVPGWRALRGTLPDDLGSGTHPGSLLAGLGPFDLVFADPPYAFDRHVELLEGVAPWLSEGGVLALEHSRRLEPATTGGGLAAVDRRHYGESCLVLYALDV